MDFSEGTHTDIKLSPQKHPVALESITVKRQLDDSDNRKIAHEVYQDLDQKSTIYILSHLKSEDKNNIDFIEETHTKQLKYPVTSESISVKRELDDFDNRETANEVDRDLDQKSTIKSEEENHVDRPYLISHEELDIKTNDDVEQLTDNRFKHRIVWQTPEDQLKMFKCPDCPFRTKYKANVKKHSVRHRNPDERVWYHCTECPYKSVWSHRLKQHGIVHKATQQVEMFKCAHCVYETPWKHYLKKHILMHDNDRLFKSTQGNLKRHQPNSTKWHACPQCSYKTIGEYSLKKHIRTHSNPDTTNLTYSLKEDSVTHNMEDAKWLQCTYCSFKTLRKSHLRMHQMTHQDGPEWHKCPDCPYKTIHRVSLLGHAKTHKAGDQTNRLQCLECSYRTSTRDKLETHQVLHASFAE